MVLHVGDAVKETGGSYKGRTGVHELMLMSDEIRDEILKRSPTHITKKLAMANGKRVTIHIQDGKMQVNGANVLSSIRASNGIVHVLDGVLLPPKR